MLKRHKYQQFKSFIKSEAERLNLNVNNTYSTFFLRLLLENLSKKNIDENFIVKGSFAQFAYLKKLVRPLEDIDLTSIESHEIILPLFLDTLTEENPETDIKYSLNREIYQTPNGIYKFKISAKYGKVNHPINIDYRENHPCIYEKQIKTLPILFKGDNEYDIIVPSLEETLAEKLCIIAENNNPDLYNTRIKDFYDIYQLLGGSYDKEKFSYYFEKMLNERQKINISDVSATHLNDDFIKKHTTIWNNTSKKMQFLEQEIDFGELIYYVNYILDKQATRIKKGKNKVYTIK